MLQDEDGWLPAGFKFVPPLQAAQKLWVSLGRYGHRVFRQGRRHLPGLQEQKSEPSLSVLGLSLSRNDLLTDPWRFTQRAESNLDLCPVFN